MVEATLFLRVQIEELVWATLVFNLNTANRVAGRKLFIVLKTAESIYRFASVRPFDEVQSKVYIRFMSPHQLKWQIRLYILGMD